MRRIQPTDRRYRRRNRHRDAVRGLKRGSRAKRWRRQMWWAMRAQGIQVLWVAPPPMALTKEGRPVAPYVWPDGWRETYAINPEDDMPPPLFRRGRTEVFIVDELLPFVDGNPLPRRAFLGHYRGGLSNEWTPSGHEDWTPCLDRPGATPGGDPGSGPDPGHPGEA